MRTVSYRDAALLLGGKQNKLIMMLDKITSGLLLGGMLTIDDVLSWFGAKAEFVRLSHDLLSSLSGNRRGLRRFTRTQRIEAAHTVIVMTAFFEAIDEFRLPQGARTIAREYKGVIEATNSNAVGRWLRRPGVLPDPARPYEYNFERVKIHYATMAMELSQFVHDFAFWQELGETDRDRITAQINIVPERAAARYEDLFRRLVVDFPEVACWAGLIEHQATRHEVKVGLAGLERMLADIVVGRSPEHRRTTLARAYRAYLTEPVLAPGEVSQEFSIPTVARAYVNPRFRVREVYGGSAPSQDSWMSEIEAAQDIQSFLVGHLTSVRAVRAPLVVLGQPGSGKSMMTKVVAARLPASDFMPVRVELRNVPAEADVQEQIEHAIRATTGERVQWPEFAAAAGDALPVILLDGFDELLQATGVHQTDYLMKVSQFQKREADQRRPVAVVVTARIAVADLARFPEETVALRLEPFSDDQVQLWIDTWNGENSAYFATVGVLPLDARSVLAYPELARQPLLLLMLALYDADQNALHNGGQISRSVLYERLLMRFAHREVAKTCPGYPEQELNRRAEEELRRLSVVAFAMFNRGTQWVTTDELDSDLTALGATDSVDGSPVMRRRLSAAEVAIGRFFFIHRARAHQAEKRVETYEFLHATFGEYLVARMTWHEVRVLAAREAVSGGSFFGRGMVDDTSLHTLLSFAPLTTRGPVIKFLEQMAAAGAREERETIAAVLIRVFKTIHDQRRERANSQYAPQEVTVLRRHAAYSVNLVILVIIALDEVRASRLFGPDDKDVLDWTRESLLWRSQLDHYYAISDLISVRRIWDGATRDVLLGMARPDDRPQPVEPEWSFSNTLTSSSEHHVSTWHQDRRLSERQKFFCSAGDALLAHLIEPVETHLPQATNYFVRVSPMGYRSIAHMALHTLLDNQVNPAERVQGYQWCAQVLEGSQLRLIIDRLRTDTAITPEIVAGILTASSTRAPIEPLVRCVMAHVGRDRDADEELLRVLDRLLSSCPFELLVECQLRLFDLDYHERRPFTGSMWATELVSFIESGQRPDLAKRARWMLSQLD